MQARPVDDPRPDFAADPVTDAAPGSGPAPDGISGLLGEVRQLATDAKTLAEAELAFQLSRAKVAGEAARNVAIYGVVAFVLAFFALGALTVGLLLALTPLITAWGATAVVVGALALGAFLCVSAAMRRIRRLQAALGGTNPGKPA
jgi:hypothetical protein